MSDIFMKNKNFSLENVSSNTRFKSLFYNQNNPKTCKYGVNTLRHLGPKIYDIVPVEIKNSASVDIFKRKRKELVTG